MFPTCVGVNRYYSYFQRPPRYVPHVCGGEPPASFIQAPLKLDDLTGAKNLLYGVDLAFGLLKRGSNKRDLVFLKHTNSPVLYDEMPPLTFDFGQGMPRPYIYQRSTPTQTMLLEFIDLNGPSTLLDLEQVLNVTRPTVRSAVDSLEDLGLVDRVSGGGHGVHTTVIPILNASHAGEVMKRKLAARIANQP